MCASVTAVICNFNKRDDVLRAVQSVFDSEQVDCRVIVVDNASSDGSAEALAQRFGDRIRLLRLPENIGGSGGFATGMLAACEEDAEYVLLLDNDAHLAPATLSHLAEFLDRRPDAAVVAPVILEDGSDTIVQEMGGRINESFTFQANFRGFARAALPAGPHACDYVAACTLLTRRSVIAEVGGFDVSYFLYWDDIDWCARVARLPNGGIFALPSAVSWHRGGGAANPVARYYQWRNRLKFLAAHADRWPRRATVPSMAEQAMRALVNSRLGGKDQVVKSILAALGDYAAGRFGRCGHAELSAPVPPVPEPAKTRHFPHVFDAIGQDVAADEAVVDDWGNRVVALGPAQVAALAKESTDFARAIAEALALP